MELVAAHPVAPADAYARATAKPLVLADGKVLVGTYEGTEIFDPATSSWSVAKAAPLATMPGWCLLPSGKALNAPASNTAQIYDPKTDSWSTSAQAPSGSKFGTPLALSNGKVLFASLPPWLYDPVADAWTPAGTAPTGFGGGSPLLALLPSGKALAIRSDGATATYDASTNAWTTTTAPSPTLRGTPGFVPMSATSILSTSALDDLGQGPYPASRRAVLYDAPTDRWTQLADLGDTHDAPGTARLSTGLVLIVGGAGVPKWAMDPSGHPWRTPLTTLTPATSIYDPSTTRWSRGPDTSVVRGTAILAPLPGGRALLCGGASDPVTPVLLTSCEVFGPVAPKANGAACTASVECQSSLCVDGVCCASACTGSCQACNVTPGTCTTVDGLPHGSRSCGGYLCASGACATSCGASGGCAAGFVCSGGSCVAALDAGPEAGTEAGTDSGSDAASDASVETSVPDSGLDASAGDSIVVDSADDTSTPEDAPSEAGNPDTSSDAAADATSGATCTADRHASVSADGTRTPCAPYACASDGRCGTACAADDGCAPGYSCDTTAAACVPTAPPSSGGCAVPAGSDAPGDARWLGLAAGALVVGVRVSRRTRRASER